MDLDDPRTQRILATVDVIPHGSVATYGQVASEAGLPGRARLVGHVLAKLSPNTEVAWHRVVASSGRISPRQGAGPEEQVRRLRDEGVVITGGRIPLGRFRWSPEGPPG